MLLNEFEKSMIGVNFSHGMYCVIEDDVIIGDNVRLGHHVVLRNGTRIGNNVVMDDHCMTTGACIIGNDIDIRPNTVVSRATIIEDKCFIGPGVMTNHTKHVLHHRKGKKVQQSCYISFGAIIGSCAVLIAGVHIGDNAIVAAGAVVIKDVPAEVVVAGNPARFVKPVANENLVLRDDLVQRYAFSPSIIKKYLPDLVVRDK